LANSPQARKRARQSEQRRGHNASQRSMVRTYIKRVIAAIQTGDYATATQAFTSAVPVIDRMADRGILGPEGLRPVATLSSRLPSGAAGSGVHTRLLA
jgi:small subunit ribosomal protein S20